MRSALICVCFITVSLLAMGRKEAPRSEEPIVEQGVAGKVEIYEGNFMPTIGQPPGGKVTPAARRRVRVHEPFNALEAGQMTARRDTVPTPLVAETITDSIGEFRMMLPVGKFSIFVEEDSGWYFNVWDGQGFQGLITIDTNEVKDMNIRITTKAVF
ncbi:hypothetical protein KKG05_00845 [bacterium]|nr:hypothetical protein [bacterium]